MPQNKNKSASTASMERLDDLEGQITVLMQSELTRSTSCIYTVPDTLTKNNDKGAYYHPQVVSIGPGPLHHSETQVMVTEKYKLEFLSLLLQRTQLRLVDLLASIRDLETEARECYSYSTSHYSDDRFLKLMVVDGCFLIELFRKANEQFKDPLATIPRAVPYVYGDLLLVGNQIPFFVLEMLFETSKILPEESHVSLSLLALKFFNKLMQRPKEVIEKFLNQLPPDQKPLHLLDLVRSSFLTPNPVPPKNNKGNTQTAYHLFPSCTKLRRAGIKFKLLKEADSFLEVKFENGAIKMPNLVIDHYMKTFLLNCVAFEQLHNSFSKQFTVYASFLDCLVDTKSDLGHLCEQNIFDNYLKPYDDAMQFIHNMGKDLTFDDDQFYLSQFFKDVNERYRSDYEVRWASFDRKYLQYFNAPWSFVSALAASVLLLLTSLQTYYTIYPYLHPKVP